MWAVAAAVACLGLVVRATQQHQQQEPGGQCHQHGGDTAVPLAQVQVAEVPRVFVLDWAFQEEELRELAREATDLLGTATATATTTTKARTRNSKANLDQAKFPRHAYPAATRVRKRLASLALAPETHGEDLVVMRYRTPEHKMEVHFDSNMDKGRYASVLLVLESPDADGDGGGGGSSSSNGGELIFPWAKRGRHASANPVGVSGAGRDVNELRTATQEPSILSLCRDTAASNVLAIRLLRGRVVIWFNHDMQLRRVGYEALHGDCPLRLLQNTTSAAVKLAVLLHIRWVDRDEPNTFAKLVDKAGLEWNSRSFAS